MMKLLLLAGTAFVSGVACAQDARPIRMIVPFSGGSASDVITRIVIERISATTGQRYVLDNRPASGGNLGTQLLAKATPDGKRGAIVVRIGPGEPGMARLEVVDHGKGIEPGVMARIFDPFFTTREVGMGSGLGLSICHTIVTNHGGTLTATSEAGKGSTFRVELPAATAEA